MSSYALPVSTVLELPEPIMGEPAGRWPDYVALAGLGPADVPELLRLARDEALHMAPEGTDVPWLAPVHAWRAVRQLLGDEAAEPLVRLLAENVTWDSDWLAQDLVPLIAGLGAAALPVLAAALAAPDQPDRAQLLWASCLEAMATSRPELREALVATTVEALARHEALAPWANGELVRALVRLEAAEAAGAIEAAYEADAVARFVAGDWPDVRFQLGLGPEPVHEPTMFERIMAGRAPAASGGEPWASAGARPGFRKDPARAKAKAARASRKKNRKK